MASYPTFTLNHSSGDVPPTMTVNAAAAALGISANTLRYKVIPAGILPTSPIPSHRVTTLAARSFLGTPHPGGHLTVLQTGATSTDVDTEDDRARIGFHLDYDDAELEATSLRWWRSDPYHILENRLFAVTVGTIPVAVYEITDVVEGRPWPTPGSLPRHHYAGTLLARLRRHPDNGLPDTWVAPDLDTAATEAVSTIMGSRIAVKAGGPIGYA